MAPLNSRLSRQKLSLPHLSRNWGPLQAQGYREDNPAGEAIGAALPKTGGRTRHQPALPYPEVRGAMERVRASRAYPSTVLAFEFLVLTACRSGEVRGARWDEMDLEAASGGFHRIG